MGTGDVRGMGHFSLLQRSVRDFSKQPDFIGIAEGSSMKTK